MSHHQALEIKSHSLVSWFGDFTAFARNKEWLWCRVPCCKLFYHFSVSFPLLAGQMRRSKRMRRLDGRRTEERSWEEHEDSSVEVHKRPKRDSRSGERDRRARRYHHYRTYERYRHRGTMRTTVHTWSASETGVRFRYVIMPRIGIHEVVRLSQSD